MKLPRSILLLMLLLFLASARAGFSALEPKVDPQTGRIRTLFIGDPFMQPGFPTPALVEDPKIDLTRIEAELGYMVIVGTSNPVATMQRFLRLYMPRSESSLIENYDAIIITAIRSDDVRMEFQRWVQAAVLEHGFGLLMSDDPVSFGACPTPWTPLSGSPWDPTPIGSVLPVYQTEHVSKRDHLFRILPVEANPVTDGLPWDSSPLIWNHNRPRAKEGAKVLAVTSDETVGTDPKEEPVLVYWDIENGRTLAFVWDWGGNGITGLYLWEYWKDFMTRLVYYIARAAIPPDVSITHTLRGKMSQYSLERGMVLSLIDFADTFGANTHQLNTELGEADDLRQDVDRLWIEEDFYGCLPAMEDALAALEAVMENAVKAKDRALLWVYMIEWLTVLGTSAIVGTVLWTLMVRRRLYRQVATTRFEA